MCFLVVIAKLWSTSENIQRVTSIASSTFAHPVLDKIQCCKKSLLENQINYFRDAIVSYFVRPQVSWVQWDSLLAKDAMKNEPSVQFITGASMIHGMET